MATSHKKHIFHLKRFGLFCLLFAALYAVRLDAGDVPVAARAGSVLAYATEMSRGALLAGTNAARAANGLGPLSENAKLNSAAQAKAQHMMTYDYWAHVAPDGTQPWYFFDQAGYTYVRAGENLAYGFSSSQGAVDGWMNSPSHRANMLGDFRDVGFGFVNAPNFVGNGAQTIVVAHYGTQPNAAPAAPAAPSTPAPTTPAPAPTPTPSTPAPTTPAPTESAPSESTPSTQQETPTNELSPTPNKEQQGPQSAAAATPVATAEPASVSLMQLIRTKSVPIVALASLLTIAGVVAGYALTHRRAFHHALATGEHFVMAHPSLDAAIIAAVTAIILLTSYGQIS